MTSVKALLVIETTESSPDRGGDDRTGAYFFELNRRSTDSNRESITGNNMVNLLTPDYAQ